MLVIRIFRTGMPDSIQVSDATAQILKDVGKKRWLERQCNHKRSENGSNAGSTSYRLSRRTKTSKSRRPNYDASCDARYEDFVIGHEFDEPSILALQTVELVTHLMKLMVADRAAALSASAACLDDVEELVDESHEADPNSNDPSRGNYEIDDEVLKQVQTLIGHVDSMFVKDKFNPCIHSLSVVEEFTLSSNSSQHVGCDESFLIGKVALVLAAFVHDVGECMGEEVNEAVTNTVHGKFSTFKFWDLFMADRYESVRAFFFANAIEQSQFLVSIVSAASAFERDPDAIPSLQNSDESLSTEHNYGDDDSMCEAVDAILSTLRKRSSRTSKRADSPKRTNADGRGHQLVNEGLEGNEQPVQAVTHVDVIADANSDDNEQRNPAASEIPDRSCLSETASGTCETFHTLITDGDSSRTQSSTTSPSRAEQAARNGGPSFDPIFFV
jgi:hypothetical protein